MQFVFPTERPQPSSLEEQSTRNGIPLPKPSMSSLSWTHMGGPNSCHSGSYWDGNLRNNRTLLCKRSKEKGEKSSRSRGGVHRTQVVLLLLLPMAR